MDLSQQPSVVTSKKTKRARRTVLIRQNLKLSPLPNQSSNRMIWKICRLTRALTAASTRPNLLPNACITTVKSGSAMARASASMDPIWCSIWSNPSTKKSVYTRKVRWKMRTWSVTLARAPTFSCSVLCQPKLKPMWFFFAESPAWGSSPKKSQFMTPKIGCP